jgi:Tol biopolymer transport system component
MTVTTRPRPPTPMPPTAAPLSDPRDPQIEPDALIEEARRRARRRRTLYACVLLAAAVGTGAYLGSGGGGGDSSEPTAPLAAEQPLVRIQAGSVASPMSNGPLSIVAFEDNGRGEGPAGWYGLSSIGLGGRLQPVVPCPGRVTWCGQVESIDWSPDGKRLALSVTSFNLPNPFNGLHVVNPATGRDQQILNCRPGECDWFDLDWSPDGSRLAFVTDPRARRPPYGSIFLIDADGSGRTLLKTPTAGRDSSPSWSPNGNWIAYAGVDQAGSAIYAIRADGSQARLLAKDGTGPAWSPDGTKIAYSTKCGVKLVTPSGDDATPPSARKCNAIGVPGLGGGWSRWAGAPPAWSPDGRQIAISGHDKAGAGWIDGRKSGTYVMNADGSNLVRWTEESLWDPGGALPRPAWQPVR